MMSKEERVLKLSHKINSFQVQNIGPSTESTNRQLEEIAAQMSALEREHRRQVQVLQQ